MTKTLATLQQLQDFDVNKLSFGQMKKPDHVASKSGPVSARPSRIPIRYNNEILRIQSSMMYLPFAHEPDISNTSQTYCTKVNDMTDVQRLYAEAFINVIKQVQDKAEEMSSQNSMEWFGKTEAAFKEASDSFTKPLKEHPENRYPPHIKVKYYRDENGLPQFPVFDGNTMQPLHTRQKPNTDFCCADNFAMNSRHVAILDCSGIWSLNKRGGLTWRMNDVLSWPPVQSFPFKNIESIGNEEEFHVTNAIPYKGAALMSEEDDNNDNVDVECC